MAESSISRRTRDSLPSAGLHTLAHKEARNIGLAALIISHSLGVVRQNIVYDLTQRSRIADLSKPLFFTTLAGGTPSQ